MATVNDKFIKTVRLWSGQVGAGGVPSPTSETIPYTGTGLTEGEVYTVTVNRVNASGTKITPRADEVFVGKVSSGNFINCIRQVEGTAQAWAVGTILEILLTTTQWNRFIEGVSVEHNADGTHNSIYVVTPDGEQTLTNKTLTSPKIGTSINDTNGNELLKPSATTNAVNEMTLANADTGNNPALSATGDDTNIGMDFKPKGTGVIRAKLTGSLQVVGAGTDTSTGDGKYFFRAGEELNGMNLVAVAACVATAGTTGTTDIQIRRVRSGTPVDMLSTKLTIDSGETDSSTAATAAVINTSNDDIQTADQIYIDIDAVSTTPAKGLVVNLTFALP